MVCVVKRFVVIIIGWRKDVLNYFYKYFIEYFYILIFIFLKW